MFVSNLNKNLCKSKKISLLLSLIIVSTVILGAKNCKAEETSQLFPFVLPWNDSSPSVTNINNWLHKPAGKFGYIRIDKDGHLYAGAQRIRFLGTNFVIAGTIPKKEHAKQIAERIAKFGINIVRFHHLDFQQFPNGILARTASNTREFDPEALDRLDYFFAQLKNNGIYVNFNLLTSRHFNAADGLPPEIEQIDWKDRHVVGFFYPKLIELQKEYALNLLTHRNPYTGLRYADDPAVAFIEINNENGLIGRWIVNKLDTLPNVFQDELKRQWNEWLKQNYGTTENLNRAWGQINEEFGNELLNNTNFEYGFTYWMKETYSSALAEMTIVPEIPPQFQSGKSVRINVTKKGEAYWHVQFSQPGINIEANRIYTLSFWAKANQPCTMDVGIYQAHEPWQNLYLWARVSLTENWQQFKFTFMLGKNDSNARVLFTNLDQKTYWLAFPSLRPGGIIYGVKDDERLEDGNIAFFSRSEFVGRTPNAQKDWIRFLWETENNYWQTMYNYLKYELGVKALIIGTDVAFTSPNMMSKLDVVDTHGYWSHPIFLPEPYYFVVPNKPMVNERGGVLPGMTVVRVFGTPFSITEYNHPAPNTYSSEAFLLLAAYAAFQDWDAIYTFAYSHRKSDDLDSQYILHWFDIDQHPTKMVTLVPAAAMFLRGDVKPANKEVVVYLNKEKEIDILLKKTTLWILLHAGDLGVPLETSLLHRVAIATEGKVPPPNALKPTDVQIPKDCFVSDTGELVWNLSESERGVVTINTQKTKAVIGFGGGKKYNLGDIVIQPGMTMQNGWSTITVTSIKDDDPFHWLVTATGLYRKHEYGLDRCTRIST
jgi:hypothetical protein